MKSLATLIKLHKTRVDEQRVHVAKLQARLEGIINAIAEIEIRKTREQLAAKEHPEARTTYGAFLKASVQRARELEKDRQIAEAAVNEALARLRELFEEQKRYEIAEEARLAAEIKEELRLERIELDEIGGVTHERRKEN